MDMYRADLRTVPTLDEDFQDMCAHPRFFGSDAASREYRGKIIIGALAIAAGTGAIAYYLLR